MITRRGITLWKAPKDALEKAPGSLSVVGDTEMKLQGVSLRIHCTVQLYPRSFHLQVDLIDPAENSASSQAFWSHRLVLACAKCGICGLFKEVQQTYRPLIPEQEGRETEGTGVSSAFRVGALRRS